jgi:hypothetical protein
MLIKRIITIFHKIDLKHTGNFGIRRVHYRYFDRKFGVFEPAEGKKLAIPATLRRKAVKYVTVLF